MRNPRLAVYLPLLAALLLSGSAALAIDPNANLPLLAGKTAWGTKRPFAVNDAGNPLFAPAPGPDGYRLLTTGAVNFTDLAANGLGPSFKLSTYACFRCLASGEQVTMCRGALTCATGGTDFAAGSVTKVCMDQTATGGVDGGVSTDWAGRSASGTGDWNCTPLY